MTEDRYRAVGCLESGVELYECGRCCCVVTDRAMHDAHHVDNDRLPRTPPLSRED